MDSFLNTKQKEICVFPVMTVPKVWSLILIFFSFLGFLVFFLQLSTSSHREQQLATYIKTRFTKNIFVNFTHCRHYTSAKLKLIVNVNEGALSHDTTRQTDVHIIWV